MGRSTFYPPKTLLVIGNEKAFIALHENNENSLDNIFPTFRDRHDIHNIQDGQPAPVDLLSGTLGVKCTNHAQAIRSGDVDHPELFVVDNSDETLLWKKTVADSIFHRVIQERTSFKSSYNLFVSVLDMDTPVEPLPSSHIIFKDTEKVTTFLHDLSETLAVAGLFFDPFMHCSTKTYTWALYSLEMNKTDFVYITTKDFIIFLVTGILILTKGELSLDIASAIIPELREAYGINVEEDEELGTMVEFPPNHPWIKTPFINPYARTF